MTKGRKNFRLRLDLLKHVTAQDILQEAMASVSRYRAEPSLGKTGKGYLRPATPEEREAEMQRAEEFVSPVKARAAVAKRTRRKRDL